LLFTGLAHFSRLLLGFFIIKLIAYYHGPEGLGFLGNFMSAITVFTVIAGGGITNGVVRFVSQYKNNEHQLVRFLSVALSYTLFVSFGVFCILLILAPWISSILFDSKDYIYLVVGLGVMQLLNGVVNLVVASINGLQQPSKYAFIQVSSLFLGVGVAWYFVLNLGLIGAGISIIVASSVAVLPALYIYQRSSFSGKLNLLRPSFFEIKDLSKYSVIAIINAVTFPVVEYLVRNLLIEQNGYYEAGLWQAAIRLSGSYIGFFSIFLAFWFLPRIVLVSSNKKLLKMVLNTTAIVSILFIFGSTIFYFFRDEFIVIMLSPDFISLSDYVGYQLLGDFFRILSYVVGFVIISKAAVSIYIVGQVLQSLCFLGFVFLASKENLSALLVIQSYSLAYFCYFVLLFSCFLVYIFIKDRPNK